MYNVVHSYTCYYLVCVSYVGTFTISYISHGSRYEEFKVCPTGPGMVPDGCVYAKPWGGELPFLPHGLALNLGGLGVCLLQEFSLTKPWRAMSQFLSFNHLCDKVLLLRN